MTEKEITSNNWLSLDFLGRPSEGLQFRLTNLLTGTRMKFLNLTSLKGR